MAHINFRPDIKLTELDLETCKAEYAGLLQDEGTDEAIVMLSFGYAEVWPDGSVVAFGNQIIADLYASN